MQTQNLRRRTIQAGVVIHVVTCAVALVLTHPRILLAAPQSNAADVYQRAFGVIAELTGEERGRLRDAEADPLASDSLKLLARCYPALDAAQEAMGIKQCQWPAAADKTDPPAKPAHLAPLQTLGLAARLRARYHVAVNDPLAAARDLALMLQLARHAEIDGQLLGLWGRIWLAETAINTAVQQFADLDGAALRLLQQRIDALPDPLPFKQLVQTTRQTSLERIITQLTDHPEQATKLLDAIGADALNRDDGAEYLMRQAGGELADVIKALRAAQPYFDQYEQLADMHASVFSSKESALIDQLETENYVTQVFLPDFGQVRRSTDRARARFELLEAAIAYRLRGKAGFNSKDDPFGRGPFELSIDNQPQERQGRTPGGKLLVLRSRLLWFANARSSGEPVTIALALPAEPTDPPQAGAPVVPETFIDTRLELGDYLYEAKQPHAAIRVFEKALKTAREIDPLYVQMIRDRITACHALAELAQRIELLTARLTETPDDNAAAAQLAELYVFAVDRPDQALIWADRTDDATFRRNLTLAVAEPGTLDADQYLQLAQWYAQRGINSAGANQSAVLKRIERYYRRLSRLAPERHLEWRQQIAAAYKRSHRRGGGGAPDADAVIDLHVRLSDDLLDAGQSNDALKMLTEARAVAKADGSAQSAPVEMRIAEVKKIIEREQRLKKLLVQMQTSPNDAQLLRRLVDLYVFELDRPAEAKAHADRIGDASLAEHIGLAAINSIDLTPEQALQLALWYARHGADRTQLNRIAMLIRAKLYYEQHLASPSTYGDARADAGKAMRSIDNALAKLGVGMKLGRRKVRKLRGHQDIHQRTPEIQKAIDKGVAWLYAKQDKTFHWDDPQQRATYNFGGYTALVTYALAMAEEDPRTNEDLRRAVDWVFSMRMKGIYSVCFRAHLWEIIPRNERYQEVVRRDAQLLYRIGRRDGGYRYWLKRADTSDTSTNLAAYLTLWLTEFSGVKTRQIQWQRITQKLIHDQYEDGGWAYTPGEQSKPTGGMTAAALTILLMGQDHLAEQQREEASATLNRGIDWLDKNFSPSQNPGAGRTNYYLAAVQHVGLLSGRRFFNYMDWYATAAEHLVMTQQHDGAWGDVAESAFGVIFLARGGIYMQTPDQPVLEPEPEPAPEPEPIVAEPEPEPEVVELAEPEAAKPAPAPRPAPALQPVDEPFDTKTGYLTELILCLVLIGVIAGIAAAVKYVRRGR